MPGAPDKGTGGVEREGGKQEVKEVAGVENRKCAEDTGTAAQPGGLLCLQASLCTCATL